MGPEATTVRPNDVVIFSRYGYERIEKPGQDPILIFKEDLVLAISDESGKVLVTNKEGIANWEKIETEELEGMTREEMDGITVTDGYVD